MTTVDDIRAALDAAVKELNALCNGQPFRMRIPVQDTDSDQVIGKALHNVGELLTELDKLQAVVEAARAFVTEQRRVHDVNERIRKGQAYEASELPYDGLDRMWGQLQRAVDALADYEGKDSAT